MISVRITDAFANGSINTTAYPYITPEYLSETRDPQAIGGIIFLLCFTTLVIIARLISRIFIIKAFGVDDYLCVLGYALFIAFTSLVIILIQEGSGRHIEYIQYILTEPEVNLTEIHDSAAHLIYTTALFICRLSGLSFFYRLCLRHPTLIKFIWLAVTFLICSFLVQFFLILFHCTPVTGLWPYAWQPNVSHFTCLNWGVVYVTNSALSLVCDFIIFSIPIAIITIVRLSKGRKVMLAFVLLPGVFVISISCVRLWLCVVGQWRADGSWYYNPQVAIEVAEIGGTLIAISVPSLKALMGTLYEKMRSTIDHTYPSTRAKGGSTWAGAQIDGPDSFVTNIIDNNNNNNTNITHGGLKPSLKPRVFSRDSDSDEDLLTTMSSRDIYVHRHVDVQQGIPMVRMAHLKDGSVQDHSPLDQPPQEQWSQYAVMRGK